MYFLFSGIVKTTPGNNLLVNIDADDLEELKTYFFPQKNNSHVPAKGENLPSTQDPGISLTEGEFVNAIQEIFGKEHLNESASLFFKDLRSKSKISDSINWDQLLESIIEHYQIKRGDYYTEGNNLLEISSTYRLSHDKDPILKLLILESQKTFCYVIINFMGSVHIYDDEMVLCHSYQVPLSPSLMRRTKWVSSACGSPQGTNVFIATSDRYLYVYDSTRLLHGLKFILSGLPNVVSCQQFSSSNNDTKQLLLLGDDSGNIHSLLFHQTGSSLFKESRDNETTCYKWADIRKQGYWVSVSTAYEVHRNYVMQVHYIAENDTILSCSPEPMASVVLTRREGSSPLFVIKLKKALKCFAIDKKLGFLATSTSDPFVCLCSCTNPSSPTIKLRGHDKNIIDVCFLSQNSSVLTLSEDGILKVWSLGNYKCVQTISIEHCFTQGEIYFIGPKMFRRHVGSPKIDERGRITEPLVKYIYVINRGVVTKLCIADLKGVEDKKPLPSKNIEPAIPRPDVLFKNYYRETPLSLQNVFDDWKMRSNTSTEETAIMRRKITVESWIRTQDLCITIAAEKREKKFFLRNGAVYLGLKRW